MASAPVSYLMYDQAEQIPLFAAFASTFKKDVLIRLAAGIGNGCCRGLSMKWLQLGCSADGMSLMGSDLAAGLGVMVEAAQLQISGQQDGADVREQLKALGMPAVGPVGTFTLDAADRTRTIRTVMSFIEQGRGRYFLSLGSIGGGSDEAIRGHAIAVQRYPPTSKLFDPNAGEIAGAGEAELHNYMSLVLRHYFAKGFDAIKVYFLN